MPTTASDEPYYVYLYRDPRSREVRYIGKGVRNRVEKHLTDSHNPGLAAWIEQLRKRGEAPIIEHFPCADEAQAFAVEGALISTFWSAPETREGAGIFNGVRGRGLFAPLGLPAALAKSQYMPPFSRHEAAGLGGALVVLISTKDFEDEFDTRPGAMPRLSLPDADVYERIVGWWQVRAQIQAWTAGESVPPKYIIGVTGPRQRRWIWGAVLVDKSAWAKAEQDTGGICRIPARRTTVNAGKLRGRLIDSEDFGPLRSSGKRRFSSVRAHQFDIIEPAS
jgi:hypothetical protein